MKLTLIFFLLFISGQQDFDPWIFRWKISYWLCRIQR